MDDVSRLLLEDPEISPNVRFLINQSPFRSKIDYLMKEFNTEDFCDEKKRPSNCLGTVLYLIGYNKTLEFVDQPEMTSLLDRVYKKTEVKEGIVAFWLGGLLQHCAINLGTINKARIIFHQPGHGGNFEPYTPEAYKKVYGKSQPYELTFHRAFPAIN